MKYSEIDFDARIAEIRTKLDNINQLQALGNMLQRAIDSVPSSFKTVQNNLNHISTTLNNNDGQEVAQKIQLLSTQYQRFGIIICKKYNVIAANIFQTVKTEKQVLTDSLKNLLIQRMQFEELERIQRKITDQ